MKCNRLIGLMLAGALGMHGAAVIAAVQDNGNLDACCLASEYRLQERMSDPAPANGSKIACQVPLGDVSCCIGAEWRLDSEVIRADLTTVAMVVTPTAPKSQPQSDDGFCCIASEWSAR